MQIKCKKCNYEWDTRSQLLMVSCPSCGTKNRIITTKEPTPPQEDEALILNE